MNFDFDTIIPSELPSISILNKNALPEVSCIYFVILNQKVQYIGRAVNLKQRWANHHIDIPDTSIAWIEFNRDNLISAESQFIKKFNPRFNWQGDPKATKFETVASLKAMGAIGLYSEITE